MILTGQWLILDETSSTQEVAAELIRADRRDIGVVFAHDQLKGKGRFGRVWRSERSDSLTFSLILWSYADWPRPWLIGMACAVAVAETIRSELRWPNDLTYKGLKTGGILTELFADEKGRKVPVVGIGINRLQTAFPAELAHATSIFLATGQRLLAVDLAQEIVRNLVTVPEPLCWDVLADRWMTRDATPGKHYRLPDGREAEGIGVGGDGALLCEVDGGRIEVMAAEALFSCLPS